MIGVPIRVPKTPGLVMVNVPPAHLVGRQRLAAGAVGEVDDRARQPDQVELLGVLDHRHQQALASSMATAMPRLT